MNKKQNPKLDERQIWQFSKGRFLKDFQQRISFLRNSKEKKKKRTKQETHGKEKKNPKTSEQKALNRKNFYDSYLSFLIHIH